MAGPPLLWQVNAYTAGRSGSIRNPDPSHRPPCPHPMSKKPKSSPRSEPGRLMLGLPKGSLQDATLEKFAKAGWNVTVSSRSY